MVTYDEAVKECRFLKGELVNDFNNEIIGLLRYLVKYYIHQDVFTGYTEIDDIENNRRQLLPNSHVELDYETGQLAFVVPNVRKSFVCVVLEGINPPFKLPLKGSIALPRTPDQVVTHNLNPLQEHNRTIERYLVNLLQFHCPGNYTPRIPE